MTLPPSGQISMSQINTELGRSSTATITIDTAEGGGYAAINTYCPPFPSSANPASMSEWYSYNHNSATLVTDVDTTSASGNCSDATSCVVNTSSITATANSTGCGGYSYSWTWVSGDSISSADNPTSATTTWSGTAPCNSAVPYVETWKCTITDNQSHTDDSVNVTVTLTNTETTCA